MDYSNGREIRLGEQPPAPDSHTQYLARAERLREIAARYAHNPAMRDSCLRSEREQQLATVEHLVRHETHPGTKLAAERELQQLKTALFPQQQCAQQGYSR
jgi:hypothetical protein